jgi:hypothetical protein
MSEINLTVVVTKLLSLSKFYLGGLNFDTHFILNYTNNYNVLLLKKQPQ